ncbi:hypothetical protein V8F06_004014 [Rhypophila decipiens]
MESWPLLSGALVSFFFIGTPVPVSAAGYVCLLVSLTCAACISGPARVPPAQTFLLVEKSLTGEELRTDGEA